MQASNSAANGPRAAGRSNPQLRAGSAWLPAWQAFVKAVETGSMAAAARAMGCTRAQVSKQIADLEAAFGARLLERSTRRLRPTPAGEVFLQHARQALPASLAPSQNIAPGTFSRT